MAATVSVTPISKCCGLLLAWEAKPTQADIHNAFGLMTRMMEKAPGKVDVIVDLSKNPDFPVTATIIEVLRGPFRHRNMGRWLVGSPNTTGRLIADVLKAVSSKDNIYWFNTVEAAYEHLYATRKQGETSRIDEVWAEFANS